MSNELEHPRSLTSARTSLGLTGPAIPTREHLRFQLDHALARDAVHTQLDVPRSSADSNSAASKASSSRAQPRPHRIARTTFAAPTLAELSAPAHAVSSRNTPNTPLRSQRHQTSSSSSPTASPHSLSSATPFPSSTNCCPNWPLALWPLALSSSPPAPASPSATRSANSSAPAWPSSSSENVPASARPTLSAPTSPGSPTQAAPTPNATASPTSAPKASATPPRPAASCSIYTKPAASKPQVSLSKKALLPRSHILPARFKSASPARITPLL